MRLALEVVLGVLLWPALVVIGALTRRPDAPWAIGGHRGRLVEDNSAALFYWMRAHADERIVWIGGPEVVAALRAEGHIAYRRGSWAARLAVFRAPVLLYSHGDDDLDPLMHLFRSTVGGLRVYLSHTLTMLKAGEMFAPDYLAAGPVGRWLRRRVMTDFDALFSVTPYEKECFDRSFPGREARIRPFGGAAHLDGFFRLAGTPPAHTLYWFPTHRDDAVGRQALARTLEAVTQHPALTAWLRREGYTLQIGAHINTGIPDVQVEPPFELRPLATLKEDLAAAALFVSDYSGLIGNFLVFDRPIVSFPFDLVSYLRQRRLFVALEDLATGPICYDLDAFVDALVSGAWHDSPEQQARRRTWRARLFPFDRPVYAASTYRSICAERDGRAGGLRAEGSV